MTAYLEREGILRFRDVVAQRLGLYFDDTRLDHLTDVLRQRLGAHGVSDLEPYLRQLRMGGREELRVLAELLTVGETYFFRYRDHFKAFAEIVLPRRLAAASARRQLRVLSAGSASGEEAYTLAILLRENVDLTSWDVKIVGIDVNPRAIEKASRGVYAAWSLRETPPDVRERYFHASGQHFRLDSSVRSMVTFEERNVVLDDPSFWRAEEFDVVFCRNVTMYFTPEIKREVVARISRSLAHGGFLFMGHAETLRGISQDFHLHHTDDTFYYERRDGSPPTLETASPTRLSSAPASLPPEPSVATWATEIERASHRIAELAERSAEHASEPAWDLQPAVEMLRQERFSEAMDLLHALPPASRDDVNTQLLRAVLLTNSGQLTAAELVCEQILTMDDLNAGAHYLMALCREHAGDATAAGEHDRAAIYLDSNFAMPHLHLGLIALRAGDRLRAKGELTQALLLLDREEGSRILLFGGGFSRDALAGMCRAQLRRCGDEP